MKRVERCTDGNPPPILTKHATKAESREVRLPIVFGGNPKDACLPNRTWNYFSPLFLWKNIFNVKYLENGDRYHGGVRGSRICNQPWAIDWHHDLWP